MITIISIKGQDINETISDPSSSWINLDDKSYFVSMEKKNIKDAKADCISKASKLFEPKNAKHNTFIAHLSERKGLSEFWVGIHHRKDWIVTKLYKVKDRIKRKKRNYM